MTSPQQPADPEPDRFGTPSPAAPLPPVPPPWAGAPMPGTAPAPEGGWARFAPPPGDAAQGSGPEAAAPASPPWAPAPAWGQARGLPSVAQAPAAGSAAPAPAPGPRGVGVGSLVLAAVLSALLASGGTALLVRTVVPAPPATVGASAAATGSSGPPAAPSGTTVQFADITGVVAQAKKSVVTITADGVSAQGFDVGRPTQGVGSGLILTANGYILTNRHVVEGSQTLSVELEDGTSYPARLVETASDNDLALVKIDASGLTAARIADSSRIQVGQTALAIGSPLGAYTETVTRGIISGLGRTVSVRDDSTGRPVTLSNLIQTDAAINPGNSGGPLLDASGAVVGLNTAVSTTAQGLGFAIPIDDARPLIDKALADQGA